MSQAQGVCVLDCSLEVSVFQSQIFEISQQPANFFHLNNNFKQKKLCLETKLSLKVILSQSLQGYAETSV